MIDLTSQRERARGCMLGQLIGDALGSQVEFQSPAQIARRHPDGVRDLVDGGTWDTIAGQPTDDSELALALARTIVAVNGYDQAAARSAYRDWYESGPFDIGTTVSAGLRGTPNYDSQSNGALMRVSPLGILASQLDPDLAARFAREDAWVTHPNEVTQDANVVFVLTIGESIRSMLSATEAHAFAVEVANEHVIVEPVRLAIEKATHSPPDDFLRSQGWVLIALQNAFFQLLHSDGVEDALIDTVGRGGDTDTTAAICGALLGAVHGASAFPSRWIEPVLSCRPDAGRPGVRQPRPSQYWPVDAIDLADRLVEIGRD
jgi:ADP-ribosyl-[dinitrogen reductase] hydrolase